MHVAICTGDMHGRHCTRTTRNAHSLHPGAGAGGALAHLDLSGNALGDAGAAALAACLREGAAPELEVIELRGNRIGKAGKAALREAREGLQVNA